MKHDTVKFWRFLNVGRPKDSEEGEGNDKELLTALFQFIGRVDMGSRLEFYLFRSKEEREGINKKAEEESQTLEELFGQLDYSNEVK